MAKKRSEEIIDYSQTSFSETSLDAEERAKRIKNVIKDITSSRKKAIIFLQEAGICDSNGDLTEHYKTEGLDVL